MRTKKLLIQLEYDPEKTRFLFNQEELETFVLGSMKCVATCMTSGQIPALTVTTEEQPDPATHHDAHA